MVAPQRRAVKMMMMLTRIGTSVKKLWMQGGVNAASMDNINYIIGKQAARDSSKFHVKLTIQHQVDARYITWRIESFVAEYNFRGCGKYGM